jgi:hypothetical protein
MIPFRFLSRRVLLWRLILATFIFFLVLNAVYFYTERKEQKLDSQSYAVIEELIKSKGSQNPFSTKFGNFRNE